MTMTRSNDLSEYGVVSPENTDKTITVAHIDEEFDVYGGRHTYGRYLANTKPGHKGWLGNPHRVSEHGREECIRLYEDSFEAHLRESWDFANAVVGLPGSVVACHCRNSTDEEPACHLDVVKEKLLDGTVFGVALHKHDITMAEWKEERAKDPQELV